MILLANEMDSTRTDENLSNINSEIQDEFDDCRDDKIYVKETVISGGDIKQEPSDTEDRPEGIYNYVDIKDEIIEDPTVLSQETGLITETIRNSPIYCKECGEEYYLYCPKCPMLIRILNSNKPNMTTYNVKWTLPKKFIIVCKTGVLALKAIPKGVVFGPFEGLNSTRNDAVSKWKLKEKELAYAKDRRWLNWMVYIRRADRSCDRNLTPFQYEGGLYYRSDRHISVGDELLVCWDSEENLIRDTEDSYLAPPVCARLDDTYACTFCCVGYKSICHLAAHNSRCPEKGNRKDFYTEIIQCVFCKIYLDEKEYSEYHLDRCCDRNTKCLFKACHKNSFERHLREDGKLFKCKSCDMEFWCTHALFRHEKEVHAIVDKIYRCSKCDYRSGCKGNLNKHLIVHGGPKTFACALCPFKTNLNQSLRRHIAVTHNDDRPYKCIACPRTFKQKDFLTKHARNVHSKGEKNEYKCPQCPFETNYKTSLNVHVNAHDKSELFQCTKCDFNTYRKDSYKNHEKRHERAGKRDNEIVNGQEGSKSFDCPTCGMTFKYKQHLAKHIKRSHASKGNKRRKRNN